MLEEDVGHPDLELPQLGHLPHDLARDKVASPGRSGDGDRSLSPGLFPALNLQGKVRRGKARQGKAHRRVDFQGCRCSVPEKSRENVVATPRDHKMLRVTTCTSSWRHPLGRQRANDRKPPAAKPFDTKVTHEYVSIQSGSTEDTPMPVEHAWSLQGTTVHSVSHAPSGGNSAGLSSNFPHP